MSNVALGEVLESSGAILHGHFLLTSGRHSAVYFEKFRVLERPDILSRLCAEIADHFRDRGITHVAGPTTGGIIIAFEVARVLGLPAIYVESEKGHKKLRRGATVPRDARILVVDDVLTTGTSVREVIELLTGEHNAKVAGVGVLIDRAQAPIDFGAESFAAYKVEAESFAPDEVPAWLAAIPITKPGTRPDAKTP